MFPYGLGRLPSPEDKRDFKMAAAVRQLELLPRPDKTWHSDRVLDQGTTFHCVGMAWCGWGVAMPVEDFWDTPMGHNIYARCKVLEGEPGEQNGSTVRTGAKVMLERKKIQTYFFAHSIDEAADYVARFGPVVLGTSWYEDMYKPSPTSNIIKPGGKLVGGHAYLWIGVDSTYATIRNSWGTGWGAGGDARITLVNLKKLFSERGEACAASEKALAIGGN